MPSPKVEILSRGTVRPSSPTPHHLNNFQLSAWDKSIPPVHGAALYFFLSDQSTNQEDGMTSSFLQKSIFLQKSLSDTLTHFFPLAGRLRDESTVDCNDEGAYFVEAGIECKLVDFVGQPDPHLFKLIIPTTDPHFPSDCMLAVQVTLFRCGGVAVSVCPSHKMMDGSSVSTFLRSWTAVVRGEAMVVPKFVEPSFSPPQDWPVSMPRVQQSPPGKFSTRRFVFPAEKIAILRAKILEAKGQHQYLTDVDLVMALILKHAIAASRSLSRRSEAEPVICFHNVNMRRRLVPQLPQNTIGNVFWTAPVVFEANEVELLDQLAGKMRKSLTEFYADIARNKLPDYGEFSNLTEMNYYGCTSLCRIALYDQEFGFGRPIWTTSPINAKNLVTLMDTREEGGIEAWICLDEEEMARFEADDELLAFAALNPNPLAI